MSIWKIAQIAVVGLAAVAVSSARSYAEPAANSQPAAPAKSAAVSDVVVPSAPRAAQIEPMVAPVKREPPAEPENKAKRAAAKKPVRTVSAHASAKPIAKSVQKKRH